MLGFGILLLLLVVPPTKAQQNKEWTWEDKAGKTHTRAELDEILKKARRYSEPYLSEELVGAKLLWADLESMIWQGANLSGANLMGANLTSAFINGAHLDGTNLATAHLDGAGLEGASLRNANLVYADLRRANLRDAELSGAFLGGAKLDGANFEPKSLPELLGFATANGLEHLTYEVNPSALVQLRQQLANGGFREQQRKISYALKRREAELSRAGCTSRRLPQLNGLGQPVGPNGPPRAILWWSDSNLANCGSFILSTVFFDWTCQYGLNPGRPLSLGVLLWLICSLLYFACIHTSGETGLYRVYGPSIDENPSARQRAVRILSLGNEQTGGAQRFLRFFWHEWLLLRTSMFFSLMSAFNIGFRGFDFGRWLRLLARQEFDIKAVGWARAVAGWQSLISMCLIALWVSTYFGRPFD
ncbi:MAG: pentapeptide repeat-containing protein [Acidobacteria bacterium]|nr:pentapeptide repeat-containing protein [Acidobacteriota bacterium]